MIRQSECEKVPVSVFTDHDQPRSMASRSAEGVMEQNAHAKISDLALLALLASNELQELNKQGDTFYVAQLFEHLSAEIPDLAAGGVERLAPSTMRVYERAVHEATQSRSNNLSSLSAMLARFLGDLKSAKQRKKVNRAEMQRLLKFLNSLHDQLITEKQRAINKRLGSRFRV